MYYYQIIGTISFYTVAFRCGEESFQCSNNICVPISSYCDGIDDCGDESDEPKLCQNYTAKISSTAKSGSLNSKILDSFITGIINNVLKGTALDELITRVVTDILGAPALDNFIERIITKIMGWLIFVIIFIIIITGIPFSLLLVCMLKPGCTIYKWRHHQQPPFDCENSTEPIERRRRQRQATSDNGAYAKYQLLVYTCCVLCHAVF